MSIKTVRQRNIIDLTGRTFGEWVVIFIAPKRKAWTEWNCRCACGTERVLSYQALAEGKTKSCGCLKARLSRQRMTTHGMSADSNREYRAWRGAKQRCTEGSTQFKWYGAKGVRVCDQWLHSFENFFKDMGYCPKGLTLDRINPFGNYSPENCRWADWKTQRQNQRASNVASQAQPSIPLDV